MHQPDVSIAHNDTLRGFNMDYSDESRYTELLSLMQEALETCVSLQNYSDENLEVFLGDGDTNILKAVDDREKIIDKLINIEYKVDTLLDQEASYKGGKALPQDVDTIRRSVRTVLSEIAAKDMYIMTVISSKMQAYKIETLKARNKKSLSAYMKSALTDELGDSFDFSK